MAKFDLPFEDKDVWEYLRRNSYLSKKYKLLYISTPKVACTSLKWWFADLEGYSGTLSKVTDSGESNPDLVVHDSVHKVAPGVTGLMPEALAEALVSDVYFRFAVVRNPYKRIFSAWQSKLLLREPLQAAPYTKYEFFWTPIKNGADVALAFEGFLQHVASHEAPGYLDYHWTPQVNLLRPDLITYTKLSRIENVKELQLKLAKHIGPGILDAFSYRRLNESLIPYLPEFITKRAAEFIRFLHAGDFQTFGYDTQLPESKAEFSTAELNVALHAIGMVRARHQRLAETFGGIEHLNEAVVERDGKIGHLNQAVVERDGQIAHLNQAVVERDGKIGHLNQAVVERDGQIAHLNQAVGERDGKIGLLNEAVAVKDQTAQALAAHLAAINSSKAWKIALLFRRIRIMIVPPNSRRARMLQLLPNVIFFLFKELRKIRRLKEDSGLIRSSGLFDEDWYLTNNPDVAQAHVDPLLHYLKNGGFEGRDPGPEFSSAWYLDAYADVKNAGMNPLVHYIRYGKPARLIPKLETQEGFTEFDASRPTVLVVSHEASRTGAPILSLNIAQNLQKKYNVVILLLRGGSIAKHFRKASTFVVGPLPAPGYEPVFVTRVIEQIVKRYEIKFAIVNSIVSGAALPALAGWFVPTISLIHEFSTYVRPRGTLLNAAIWSSELVFSAATTRENAVFDYPELKDHPFHVVPQGRCDMPFLEGDTASQAHEDARVLEALRPEGSPSDTVVILGVGSVQIRKGVDLFIDCAARVVQAGSGKNFRFVWIGNGYDPEGDMQYSIYLSEQIQRAGLQELVHFLEETSSIEAAYRAADVLIISSRLDPLPNVAIDAMMHELPLVCFERTTGIADVLIANGLGDECVAPYLDTARMAAKVLAFAQSESLGQHVGMKLRQVALKEFDMESYVSQLERIGLASSDRAAQEHKDVSTIIESGLARLDYFVPPPSQMLPDEAIRYYVRMWASGIGRRKLFPGFHPGIYLEQNGLRDARVDPLADYLRAGQPPGPWRYDVITSEATAKPTPPELRIALHLHVYYLDLLPEMLKRLNSNQARPDLYVSVTSESLREEVQGVLFRGYSGKVMEILVVPNRGQDMGSFLTGFGATFLDHYDVVGHLHTTKSSDTKNKMMGKNWFLFLLENLLGGKSNMADIVLGRLAADPSIGMIFPDDPNVVGWGTIRPQAQALSQRLGLDALPEYLSFPGATMFWARVEFLRPIFDLHLTWQDFPTEPLPDDGSILHALERLLPLVASSQGFRWVLTNVTGITR